MAQSAVDVLRDYFEGADLVEGVEMTILDDGRPRPFPVCVCHGQKADDVITDLQTKFPPVEQGPKTTFGERYPQFRKVFVFCLKG